MRRAAVAIVAHALIVALAWLVSLSGAACTITLPGSDDGGTEAAATGDAGVGTVGQVCTQILTELCSQSINRCGLQGFTIADCVSSDMSQCCSTTCSQQSTASQSTVASCKSAFDTEDCNDVTNNTTPSACSTLIGM